MAVDKVYPVPVLLLVMMVGYSHEVEVTDQSVIIARVNQLRSSVGASDMAEMTWSPDLAIKANDFSSTCTTSFGAVPPETGALLFMVQHPTLTTLDSNVAIDQWASQAEGGYAQLVWGSTSQMGCAYTKCPSIAGTGYTNAFVYACLFSPRGNIKGIFPYDKTGPTCSKCPSGAGWCTPTDLCRSSCVSQTKDCQCKQTCVSGGTVDPVTCKCVCPPGFHGIDCSRKCVDGEKCNPPPYVLGYLPSMCNEKFVQDKCPKMCKLCT